MTKVTRICNMCGSDIERYNDFEIRYQYGYESHNDGDYLELDLCGNCLDKLTTWLEENCKINPVIRK
jgi:hypothetical protein